jgi:hypothetical protein
MHLRMNELLGQLVDAGKRRAAVSGDGWGQAEQFDATVEVLRADYSDLTGDTDADSLADLADVFGLDPVDASLLWCVAAADLDANVSLAYAALRGLVSISRPTVGLVLELVDVATGSAEAFTRLAPTAPLRRHRLLAIDEGETWLASPLRVPIPVTATLAGASPDDPLVKRIRCSVTPLQLEGSERVQRAIEHGESLIWVYSTSGAAGASLAAGAVAATGLQWLAVDARRCHGAEAIAEAMALAAREAGLLGRALIVTGGECLVDAAAHDVFARLADAAVPVIVTSRRSWNSGWLPRLPLVVLAEPLPASSRAAMWQDHLGELLDDDATLAQTLVGLRLSPEDVAETARYARLLAHTNDRPIDAAAVREAARRVGGAGGSTAERIETTSGVSAGPTFADLVLPEHAIAPIRQLVTWGRHRNEVTANGPLRRHGRGIAALFAGNSGTGKTLAAHVVAEQLSVDLFQVELAGIVDKYIGETEKNLEKVFQAAEALDVVLFFDEADALFGSRSEVNDARDRYANQEVAYLLQRMEHFDGITILATNLRGNLDRAFSRRMSFIIHFPDPDAPSRRRLWERHLAQLDEQDRSDPVLVDFLADELALTGGDIRNIVLAATYDAVGADEVVGMRHVVAATVREFQKLGKVVPEHALARLSNR